VFFLPTAKNLSLHGQSPGVRVQTAGTYTTNLLTTWEEKRIRALATSGPQTCHARPHWTTGSVPFLRPKDDKSQHCKKSEWQRECHTMNGKHHACQGKDSRTQANYGTNMANARWKDWIKALFSCYLQFESSFLGFWNCLLASICHFVITEAFTVETTVQEHSSYTGLRTYGLGVLRTVLFQNTRRSGIRHSTLGSCV